MTTRSAILEPPTAAAAASAPDENRHSLRCALSSALVWAYAQKPMRATCLSLARRLEGGEFYSFTLREILNVHHGVEVGDYSYGECLTPGSFPAGASVGRYASIAYGVRVFLRNHPLDRLSTHPFFFNRCLELVDRDTIPTGTFRIEHDAWVGERAMFTPGCRRVGLGAVVGAGAVVTRDVPDFAIVAGNPARVVRMRFEPDVCDRVRRSRWWEKSVDECARVLAEMVRPLGPDALNHPLLKGTD